MEAGASRSPTTPRSLWKNPGMWLACILLLLWLASWVAFLGLTPGAKLAGIPLVALSQILLGALGVGFTIIAIPLFEKWESK